MSRFSNVVLGFQVLSTDTDLRGQSTSVSEEMGQVSTPNKTGVSKVAVTTIGRRDRCRGDRRRRGLSGHVRRLPVWTHTRPPPRVPSLLTALGHPPGRSGLRRCEDRRDVRPSRKSLSCRTVPRTPSGRAYLRVRLRRPQRGRSSSSLTPPSTSHPDTQVSEGVRSRSESVLFGPAARRANESYPRVHSWVLHSQSSPSCPPDGPRPRWGMPGDRRSEERGDDVGDGEREE